MAESALGSHRPRRWAARVFIGVLLLALLLAGAWTWFTLSWSYSEGERAGSTAEVFPQGLDLQDLRRRTGAVHRRRRGAGDLVFQHPRSGTGEGVVQERRPADPAALFGASRRTHQLLCRDAVLRRKFHPGAMASCVKEPSHEHGLRFLGQYASTGKPVALRELRRQGAAGGEHRQQVRFHAAVRGLEALYKQYRDRGLAVLGFPCNQFGAQEPGTAEEIGSFCQKNYGVSFPMFEKIDVNGAAAHPLYRWLKSSAKGRAGQRSHQVELHQVPGRPQWPGGRSLRAHHQARRPESQCRGTAVDGFDAESCAACWRPALVVLAWSMASQAEEKPLWEAGLGVGAVAFPDYRGSDEVQCLSGAAAVLRVPRQVSEGRSRRTARRTVRSALSRAEPEHECDHSGEQRRQRRARGHAEPAADVGVRAVAGRASVALGQRRT